MPRLFIAVDVSDETKEQLFRFRVDIPAARWVPREQLHLTMAFLGDVEREQINTLVGTLSEIRNPAFDLSIGEPGCFPNRKRPRTLWIGIKPEPHLMVLAEQLRKAILSCGIVQEARPFFPHITLARIKQPSGNDGDAFLNQGGRREAALLAVREFILFESRLGSRGVQHIPLRKFQLTAQGKNDLCQ
ncbi:MAG: RNA 2',3'-cyclic phosphodiesterase [Desulfuromonadales bacterium]|nr:RNA 2',3'-cyclic phosphodiesterase [Desulfuromonadales bacterium]